MINWTLSIYSGFGSQDIERAADGLKRREANMYSQVFFSQPACACSNSTGQYYMRITEWHK